ncbi:uncharacterized protein LOC135217118 isoform X2 [Macrobrachium nipponense]|uniref:uncharacterized protein LOC135217118 isoform X2 n=1 Tax=Macrobrachium nipponense TaxID=159736 RepID=UPI0030C7E506
MRSKMLPPAVRWLCLLLLAFQGTTGQLSIGEPNSFLLEDLEPVEVTTPPSDAVVGEEPQVASVTESPPDDTTVAEDNEDAINPETIGALEDEAIILEASASGFGHKMESDVVSETPLLSSAPELTKRILVSGTPPATPVPETTAAAFSRHSSLVRFLSDPNTGWLPNWPSHLLPSSNDVPNPTIIFPTEPEEVPAATPVPSIEPSLTVSKVPVTQYYFDISSAAPSPPPGPLFDPEDFNLSGSLDQGNVHGPIVPADELVSSIPELQSSAVVHTAEPVSVTPTLPDHQTLPVTESPAAVPEISTNETKISGAPTQILPSVETEIVDNDLASETYNNNVTTLVSDIPNGLNPTGGLQPSQSLPDPLHGKEDAETATPSLIDFTSALTSTDPIAVLAEDQSATEEKVEVSTVFPNPEVPLEEEEAGGGVEGTVPKEPPAKEPAEGTEETAAGTAVPEELLPTTEKDATTKATTEFSPPTYPPVTTPPSTLTVTVLYPDSRPSLTTSVKFPNGTVHEHPLPYVKALVAYSQDDFCLHENNFKTMFAEWISQHLQQDWPVSPSEIEFFNMPDCGPKKPPGDEHINQVHGAVPDSEMDLGGKVNSSLGKQDEVTSVYFYVTRSGEINPNLTEMFPLFPKDLEISEELTYLRAKVSQLELVRPGDLSDATVLTEEAAIGTSAIVSIVIATIVMLSIITAIIFFMIVKKRGSTNNYYGRRCTPVSMDAYSMDSVSVYHSFRRKSKRRASGRSVKSYLNQAFDDPNGPSRPLNFAKLTHFISDIDGVHEEFSTIPVNMPKYDELPAGVEDKNRYANVIPVPETRVLLKCLRDSPNSEYINANYVRGPRNESKYYIATQAPLDDTVADFWRMIWEQETRVVVMLTDFVEKGIDKCADYLPPSETLDCHRLYGDFQVTLKSRDMREKYVVSNVQLKNLENNLVREIAHMWFTGWPASGVPNEESAFISYILDIRRTRKKLRAKGPIVVHCSPGTGRSGTFLACDLVMRQFEDQRAVDIPRTVYSIRRDRAGAVQTKEQYAFIYRVINLYASKLTTGNLDSL